jgi:DNA-binding CsgD family transcriptional regulator
VNEALTAIGRDRELAEIASFLDIVDDTPRVLLIEGEAGIGKTTLWRAGVAEARERGYRVLACTGAEAEAQLAFTALRDLIDPAFDEIADELPTPQRRALAVTLLREEPPEPPPAPDAIAVASLSTLRALAAAAPMLLAIDDVQWLDPASASVLGFAFRRFRSERICSLVAQRVVDAGRTTRLGLERAFGERLRRLRVAALSLGALHRILRSRLDLTLPRPMLQRVHEACEGNPFFALQIGAVLKERGLLLDPSAPLPIPESLDELLRRRIDRVPASAREALLAAAASARSEIAVVEAASSFRGVEEALARGILVSDGTRLLFTHPLFGETVYVHATPKRRREMHLRLAALLEDPEAQGQQLALGTAEPSAEVAAAIDRAAEAARRRGATASAAGLAEHAARLTPADDGDTVARRTITAATWWTDAGDMRRSRALVEPLLAKLPRGPRHFEALYAKARAVEDHVHTGLLEEAVAEADGYPSEQVRLLFQLCYALVHSQEFDVAREHAQAAVDRAEQTGDSSLRVLSLSMAGRLAVGAGGLDALHRARELDPGGVAVDAYESPATWLGWWLLANDELDGARQLLVEQHRKAIDDGDEWNRTFLHWPLTEVECRAGNYDAARAYAEDGAELAEQSENRYAVSLLQYCRALVAAHLGESATAIRYAEESLASARAMKSELFAARPCIALAFLAVSEARYTDGLHHVAGLTKLALEGPYWATYPFWGDMFEALVHVGDFERALALLAEVDGHRHAVERPGSVPVLARCRGLVQAASGSLEDGIASVEEALRLHDERPVPLERARTLLTLGELQRRAKQRRAARLTLQEALTGFEALGATLWSERAREEIAHIGGRAPAAEGLTPSEQRIAELVAEGKTNKEVAAVLVVADRTVESALTQIYRKLDVRSRTELARKLAAQS